VSSDLGDELKLSDQNNVRQMRKAKSLLKDNQSEPLLSQAFEVIFKEIERYV
jgi:hypothetical protein